MSHEQHSGQDHGDAHHGGAHHPRLGFFRKWVFSTDHKVIGMQYAVTSLVFLLFGFFLMTLMRYQLAYPGGNHAPGFVSSLFGALMKIFGSENVQDGVMQPEFYNQLGAMHGTIMVFLGVVPLAVGGFGNFVMPLQIGAPDMAFPRLNMASYWVYFVGGIVMLYSFTLPGGTAQYGWTSYPPLSVIEVDKSGQTFWLLGMVFLITSSLLGSVNFIATIVQLRAPGLDFFRLPFFTWAQFVTAFLLLLAFPPLEAASVLQLMDRVGRHQLLHADRIGGRRHAVARRGRRQSAPVAAPVLVPGPPRGVRADPASAWGSSPRSSRTTPESPSGAIAPWCMR